MLSRGEEFSSSNVLIWTTIIIHETGRSPLSIIMQCDWHTQHNGWIIQYYTQNQSHTSLTVQLLPMSGWFPPVFSLESINIDAEKGGWASSQSLSLSLSPISLSLSPSLLYPHPGCRQACTHRQIDSASVSLSLLHLCISIPPSFLLWWILTHCFVEHR